MVKFAFNFIELHSGIRVEDRGVLTIAQGKGHFCYLGIGGGTLFTIL